MKRGAQNDLLMQLLLDKYRADPGRFRTYMPEVAEVLDALPPPRHTQGNPFGLTERERAHRQRALAEVVERLGQDSLSREEAVRGLEHCATLIQDDTLPSDLDHDRLLSLLRVAIGKSPSSVKAKTVIAVQEGHEQTVVNKVSILRGVVLNLTWDMRLVSVTITPRKVQERRKALRFIGVSRDVSHDVAQRHDDYLAEKGHYATA